MKAAFNNPNRAAEYLMSGIPDNIFEQVSEQQQQQQPSQGQQGTTTTSTTSTLETMLKQHPQFNQIKAAIQNNPDLLQPALTKIAQDDPNLMSVIQQNSQEFLRLINEPVSQTEDDGSYDGEEDDGQGEEGDHPPGTIFITQQEKQDIDSVSLFFSFIPDCRDGF
jgi:UV excision repair protein RAD23